jgi:8-oxo-dGTP pyrophosphatase MutT (NUDIX family)
LSERTGSVEPVALAELPEWLRGLAVAAREVTTSELFGVEVPDDGDGRASAVLMTLTETPVGPGLVLIQRSAGLRRHAGQVAFPGGAVEPVDPDHVRAALREAEEEVGLDPAGVRIVAELPAIFIQRSGFLVTPVLAWWPTWRELHPADRGEVAAVAVAPIAELAEPANRFSVLHPSGWVGPGFEVGAMFIWGFTAGLIDRLLVLGGWGRPWDPSVTRSLPPEVLGRPATGD